MFKNKFIVNIFSLSSLQLLNVVTPILMVPYILQTIGIERYGLVGLALSTVLLMNIFVSYGFELTSTKKIAVTNNLEDIGKVFWETMICKIILMIIMFVVLIFLIELNSGLNEDSCLYYISFGVVVANVITPAWYFQGRQDMKVLGYYSFFSKIVYVILVVNLVKGEEDYLYVAVSHTIMMLANGLPILYLALSQVKFRVRVSISDVVKTYSDSFEHFLSRLVNNGSRHLVILIVGKFFGNESVGLYTLVEKFLGLYSTASGVVSQVLYPKISASKDLAFYKKVVTFTFPLFMALTIILLFLGEYISEFLSLDNDVGFLPIYYFVIAWTPLIYLNTLLGFPLLGAMGYERAANYSLIYASLVFIIYALIASLVFDSLYMIAMAIPVYHFTCLIFRVFLIKKENVLDDNN